MFLIIVFSTSGIILTSETVIPQFEFSQLLKKAIFLSCVLPDKISFPIIKIAAFTFFFFLHRLLTIYEFYGNFNIR